jgi:hypothetical protein
VLKLWDVKEGEFVTSGLVPPGRWSCLCAATNSMRDGS